MGVFQLTADILATPYYVAATDGLSKLHKEPEAWTTVSKFSDFAISEDI